MVNTQRARLLSTLEYTAGTVIYQMCRDIRAFDNDALLFAQELATKQGAKLIVTYVIWNYRWAGATRRFYDWVIPSLQEVEDTLRKKNIPLVLTFQNERLGERPDERGDNKKNEIPSHVGAVVIDQLPLRFMKKWKDFYLTQHSACSLYEVDAHNCIPVWETSQKQEYAARTIRSKIYAKLPSYLEDYDELSYHEHNGDILKEFPKIKWSEISSKIICDETVLGTGSFIPGESAGKKAVTEFLHNKLPTYDTTRNDIAQNGQSNLSPYLAHGNISRRSLIKELLLVTGLQIENVFDPVKNGSNGKEGSVAAFIEESVVRAELCENFCFYNPQYDSFEGFPAWAKETLRKASSDTRAFTYTYDEFKNAKTHDNLWNAAQAQMVQSGKMHGYMRMYWAKKILEWTKSPKEAMDVAVSLNDTYELDGRDPNGYVGCAWSIGGVHDRPWFGRPIFGTVRYMAESGVKKRGDTKQYIDEWRSSTEK